MIVSKQFAVMHAVTYRIMIYARSFYYSFSLGSGEQPIALPPARATRKLVYPLFPSEVDEAVLRSWNTLFRRGGDAVIIDF